MFGKVDPLNVSKMSANVITPATLIACLFWGSGFLQDQEESDTKLRIHVELLDNRLNTMAEKIEEAERDAEKARAELKAQNVKLNSQIEALRECVAYPKKCR